MPLLNATSVPYTGVPAVGTPPDAGGQTQRISADASSFGSLQGAATSQLGQTLERAGDQFAQIAIQRQEIYNKVAVTEAGNNLTDNWNKTLFGDPNNPNDHGYYGTQGRQAGDEFPNARNKLDAAFNDARSQLQNPQQQLLFDAEMRRQRAYNLSTMGRHYDNEYKKYVDATYAGTIKQREGGIATAGASMDSGRFTSELGGQMRAIEDRGQAKGLPREEIDAQLHDARSNAVKIWVASLSSNDKANEAEQFLKENVDAIGGVHGLEYPQLLTSIRAAAADERFRRARAGEKPTYLPPGSSAGATITPDAHYAFAKSIGASDNEATLLTSAADSESGFNHKQPHDGGIGYGLYGHNGSRLASMIEKYGKDPSAQDQIRFALDELRSRPEGEEVNSATTADQLTELQLRFERPRNLRRDYRLAATQRYMGIRSGKPPEASKSERSEVPTSTASTKVGGIPTNLRTVGDSLSGMLVNSGVPGALDTPYKDPGQPITSGRTSGGSDQPDRILARMKGLPDDFYKGNTIFLTAGSNMPSKIRYVEDQIALARVRGAEAVIVPALGPGIKGYANANQVLRYFAAEKGAIFFEPKIEWDKEGVHPKNATEVAKFRQQGLDALAAAKGPPT